MNEEQMGKILDSINKVTPMEIDAGLMLLAGRLQFAASLCTMMACSRSVGDIEQSLGTVETELTAVEKTLELARGTIEKVRQLIDGTEKLDDVGG